MLFAMLHCCSTVLFFCPIFKKTFIKVCSVVIHLIAWFMVDKSFKKDFKKITGKMKKMYFIYLILLNQCR